MQENVPEILQLKKTTWAKIDDALPESSRDEVVLATSTSGIMPGKISQHLRHRENFIVAHPV